jgi:hypothetical protein
VGSGFGWRAAAEEVGNQGQRADEELSSDVSARHIRVSYMRNPVTQCDGTS